MTIVSQNYNNMITNLIINEISKATTNIKINSINNVFNYFNMIKSFDEIVNKSIIFEEGKVIYKKKTIDSNNVSMKYFKFHISVIEPSLVIPKIHINGNNLSVTCYLSKKDIKKLKKMNFEIKEI